ncbi:hypothetical protein ACQEV4_04990 [Streptomyces shenzhenensis]|uniref:hypothetical protein n=1 Tax=Streptomyces shenzhenensis TaxID=943815 RepID=UPI003D8ED1E3
MTISYTLPPPTLAIAKTHTGNFTQGKQSTYTITVRNTGLGPTDGSTVTVRDKLPRGLTARSITGTGWKCVRATLTCTRSDVLAPGDSYPPITLKVKVACDCETHRKITNTASVSGGGDIHTHTVTDRTTVKRNKHCHRDGHDPR